MTIRHLTLLALCMAVAGCDKSSTEVSKKIAELEQKATAAEGRQRELEQQLADQRLAADRDAIERERMKIEEDRAELERQKGEAAAAEDEALRKREEALANREGKLEQVQTEVGQKAAQLSERDREVAGREALALQAAEQSEPVADYGIFYDSLSAYGSWFESPEYGYIWQPAVVRDASWRPYSRGRWVCSDRGWTWISDEPFGWATYHYGRWALLRGRGWVWVPGAEWAPSWVSWRESDSYIGWAPLPPETLAYRGHGWDSTVDVQFGIGALWFNFVDVRHFGEPIHRYRLPVAQNVTILQQTNNITHIHIENRQVIAGGPRYNELSKRVGKPLPFYHLEVDPHPRQMRDSLALRPQIQGDRLTVAAPNVDAAWNEGLRPKRVKQRLESVSIERSDGANREVAERFRQSREEGRLRAERTIVELGGRESFDKRRAERLQENRRQADLQVHAAEKPAEVKKIERPVVEVPNLAPTERTKGNEDLRARRELVPGAAVEPPLEKRVERPRPALPIPQNPLSEKPSKQAEQQQADQRRAEAQASEVQKQAADRSNREQLPLNAQQELQRQAGQTRQKQQLEERQAEEQAREVQKQAADRSRREQLQLNAQQELQRQAEQIRQKQQLEQRRAEEQAREVQKAAQDRSRRDQLLDEQRQANQAREAQQETARRAQLERARELQQEQAQQRQADLARQAQREAADRRQAEQASQRQLEQTREAQREAVARQRQQAEQEQSQRQQEQARQRQIESQRQTEPSRARPPQERIQRPRKNQEDPLKDGQPPN